MSLKRFLLPLLFCTLGAEAALAQPPPRNPPPPHRGGPPPRDLDDAVAGVRKRVDGKVLSVETKDEDGQPQHIIRVLTPDGRVRRMRVDAPPGPPPR